MSASTFKPEQANLRGADFFPRFNPPKQGEPLSKAGLSDDVELIVIERCGEHRGFVMRELAHPHMAQGELAGEPYLVSF